MAIALTVLLIVLFVQYLTMSAVLKTVKAEGYSFVRRAWYGWYLLWVPGVGFLTLLVILAIYLHDERRNLL